MRVTTLGALALVLASWNLAAQDAEDEPAFKVPETLRDPFVLVRATEAVRDGKDEAWRQRDLVRMGGIEHSAEDARALLGEGKVREAFDRCGESLKTLGEVERPEELAAYGRLQGVALLREELLRIRAAALRHLERQEAEAAFKRLNLRVSGIVVSETRANAVVNGKVVGAGEILVLNGEESGVRIEEIRPEMLVVSYRGLKMPVTLQ